MVDPHPTTVMPDDELSALRPALSAITVHESALGSQEDADVIVEAFRNFGFCIIRLGEASSSVALRVLELGPSLFDEADEDSRLLDEREPKRRKQEIPESPSDILEATEYSSLFRAGYIKLRQRAGWRMRRLGASLRHPKMPAQHSALEREAWRLFDTLETIGHQLVGSLAEGVGLDRRAVFQHAGDIPTEGIQRHGVSASPFDLFYYPNRLAVPNCTPHLDPGFVSLAPCALQPGLLVLDLSADLEQWIPIDKILEPGRDLIAFAGESLEAISRGAYPACSHAVARGDGGRCSVVYELQTSTGKALQSAEPRVKAGGPGWLQLEGQAAMAHQQAP